MRKYPGALAAGLAAAAAAVVVVVAGCGEVQEVSDAATGPADAATGPVDAADTVDPTDAGPADAAASSGDAGVDRLPPNTTITVAPAAMTREQVARFEFAASEPTSRYLCKVDDAAPVACSSPFETEPLGSAAHRFEVQAIDLAGNPDPVPAVHEWTIDAALAGLRIDAAPPGLTRDGAAQFRFSSDEDVTFECQLDSQAVVGCGGANRRASSFATTVGTGGHTFTVFARDDVGNQTQASHTWTVDVVAPTIAFVEPVPTRISATGTIRFGLTATEPVTFTCELSRFDPETGGSESFGRETCGSGTSASASFGAGAIGDYYLDVSANDGAGNPAAAIGASFCRGALRFCEPIDPDDPR